MLIFIGACVAVFVLGYVAGRHYDRVDIHRTPARPTEPPPFEAAIERLTTDAPGGDFVAPTTDETHLKMFHVRPGPTVAVMTPDEMKVRRAAPRKRKARK